ncbi:MAG: glycerophosphodiester phosphodiesterase [bacterium]
MQIIAHRGASAECVENTLEAFKRAYEEGADFIEFDLQQTSDNRLVIFHDSHFQDGVNISDITYKEFKERTDSLGIPAPLFKDALEFLRGKAGINIELKRLFDLDLLLSEITLFPHDKILFSSFDHTMIASLLKKAPNAMTGTLMVSRVINPFVCMRPLHSKILIQHYGFVTKDFVETVHKHNCKIFVWTVNYISDIYWFINLGVDGIFTDYPARVREIVSELSQKVPV